MAELTEQQTHLASLVTQRDKLNAELESLKAGATATRDLYMKVVGAIEYLTQVGVKLPEPEVAEEEAPSAEAEAETTEEG